MSGARHRIRWLLAAAAFSAGAASAAAPGPAAPADATGAHGFDFNFGTWHTHVKRLQHPLSGGSSWVEYDGRSVVSKIWDGRASLFELDVDGPAGHIEGMGLRLYNPTTGQWGLNWASRADGEFQTPTIGQFAGGRGEFVDAEVFDGKSILVRNAFSDIAPDSAHFEQAFSADGGRSWETNWVMTFARAPSAAADPSPAASGAATEADGRHDFDFAFGSWKTHIRRLKDPLSGSTQWLEYDGTHTIRKVWGGRANLGELEADGAAGHIEAVSPRLFNPRTHLWNVRYGNPREGGLSPAVVGRFDHGRGEFYGADTYKGKAVLVREIYTRIDAKTRHLDIAYSQDGGRTWETNWDMTDTRVDGATK